MSMITGELLLVTLVKLVDYIPTPPPPKRKRGRRPAPCEKERG